jgi:acetamidase/formamidase
MTTHHEAFPSPETVHWGVFNANFPPIVEIESGDIVTLHTVSGGADIMPNGDQFEILPDHLLIHEKVPRGPSGHIMTGPVAVKGARAGDMLEIRIQDVQLRQNWGWNRIRALAGTLPEDFPETRLTHILLDKNAMVAKLPWGVDLPLAPFFGVMGVAPPPGMGGNSVRHPARPWRQSGQ